MINMPRCYVVRKRSTQELYSGHYYRAWTRPNAKIYVKLGPARSAITMLADNDEAKRDDMEIVELDISKAEVAIHPPTRE